MSIGEWRNEVYHLRHQLSLEESSLLSHKEKLRGFASEYFSQQRRLKDGEFCEEDKEEYDYYKLCEFNFTECKNTIGDLTTRLQTRTEELEEREEALSNFLVKMASKSSNPVRDEEGRVVQPTGDLDSVHSAASFDPEDPIDNECLGREENIT